jgi:hypothetical protein
LCFVLINLIQLTAGSAPVARIADYDASDNDSDADTDGTTTVSANQLSSDFQKRTDSFDDSGCSEDDDDLNDAVKNIEQRTEAINNGGTGVGIGVVRAGGAVDAYEDISSDSDSDTYAGTSTGSTLKVCCSKTSYQVCKVL